MTRDAWKTYAKYAWSDAAVNPSGSTHNHWFGHTSGWTIVSSMSTLLVMQLDAEFEAGRQWIKTELDFTQLTSNVTVFYSISYYLGGLLSSYALTGDKVFKQKAVEIGNILETVFYTPTG